MDISRDLYLITFLVVDYFCEMHLDFFLQYSVLEMGFLFAKQILTQKCMLGML
ncbi:conserved hypothetical protein [Escherichia fergusonii ATCC 35469]|uniref:Uncharacterized protein n=1 Tax=Escherichia fergusonii (strain ATCC 35469 / DSM 13698 / CCUG 18766 / IAM 14443 / JCM 21226 / LMG 7866 / NBRC 102419 / NCTC 12128 / CDC 0568-73) TaxID=585054 RepID=B7LJH3_ESCF3|nr:conserved hypothetical protein [Escherichia fergusonii ATCC 35469]